MQKYSQITPPAGTSNDQDEWIAAVSGLNIGSPNCPDALVQLLVEFLIGESSIGDGHLDARRITRLIIAGNSMAQVVTEATEELSDKKLVRPRGLLHQIYSVSHTPLAQTRA